MPDIQHETGVDRKSFAKGDATLPLLVTRLYLALTKIYQKQRSKKNEN